MDSTSTTGKLVEQNIDSQFLNVYKQSEVLFKFFNIENLSRVIFTEPNNRNMEGESDASKLNNPIDLTSNGSGKTHKQQGAYYQNLKIHFSKFDGTNRKVWVRKCERFSYFMMMSLVKLI